MESVTEEVAGDRVVSAVVLNIGHRVGSNE